MAFASTFHGLQGITCNVPIDVDPLGWAKEEGKWVNLPAGAYVALSRAVSVDLIRLTRPLEMSHIRAHPTVLAWHRRTFGDARS